ncbi:sensor histidine kinase [Actinopolymorpha pittospori]|uniref:histidine kinase n=1 Tax=Actinopolymorpha pittospori TaxID=648752 RepID=A0A927MYS6_9ACTN|nr:HAMP domain-containing sensor histidine kinase [Actinopolymorpha pittospori]MBE1609440.1 two-component system sensor histidine kinase MprB [Actinopolymorpha pittospori]
MTLPNADGPTRNSGPSHEPGPIPEPAPDSGLSLFRNLSLRSRVGLLAAFGVGIIVVLISLAAYITVRASLLNQVDANLLDRARSAAAGPLAVQTELAGIPSEALGAADIRIALLRADGYYISPSDQRGDPIAPPLGAPEREVARGALAQSVRTSITHDGTYRVVAVPVARTQGYALVLSQSQASTQDLLNRLGFVLLIVGGTGIAVAAWAGVGIARTGLRPVQRLTAGAEHVARTGDLRPIPVQGNDELTRLAHAFNAMLSALAEARARERRLIADAGHELRTPLTSLRTNLDLLAQSEGRPGLSPEDRLALLEDVRAQLVELSSLVGDLVELSREDPPAAAHIPVDLADVVSHAAERVRRRAPSVRFDVEAQPWTVFGDAPALERAVTNLLDNAAKWSPPGGIVSVSLRHGVLSVADQGPGIADADLPHVFERFYRSTEARTMPGSGLGLSIVKQAADRHGGSVSAGRNSQGGALLTLRLPGMSSPAPPGPSGRPRPDGAR